MPRILSAAVIKARIRKLEQQAAKLELKDSKGIRAVAAYIDKHGLSLDEVKQAFGMARGRKRGTRAGSKVEPKYRDDSGNVWSGRGRPPLWLVAEEKAGKKRESFLIDKPTPEPVKPKANAKPKAKKKAAKKATPAEPA